MRMICAPRTRTIFIPRQHSHSERALQNRFGESWPVMLQGETNILESALQQFANVLEGRKGRTKGDGLN